MQNWLKKIQDRGDKKPRKSEFIYPTKKNMLSMLMIFQMIPSLIFYFSPPSLPINFWLKFEAIIIAVICAWPMKPEKLMTKRDRAIELKWTNMMFTLTLPCLVIPMAVSLLVPDASPWTMLNSFIVPVFLIVMVLCAVIRIQQGGFFSNYTPPQPRPATPETTAPLKPEELPKPESPQE